MESLSGGVCFIAGAYLKYETASECSIFADYQYSEKAVVASAVEDETETPEESTTPKTETNPWLLASSLAIAAMLGTKGSEAVKRSEPEKAEPSSD